jgi:DNA polymerase III delta prime subunit
MENSVQCSPQILVGTPPINPVEKINKILGREAIQEEIKTILQNFDKNCKNINFKKGIYIYGATGCGKTEFVMNLLKEMNYDVIKYDAGDVRNKSLIDTITSNNISNRNVLHMMQRKVQNIAIVMDEIDGMNNGDKGGITSLIKLIRQKKTKKQKSEDVTLNPIICIGNYFMDKKIRELMKVCNVFELKTPTDEQMSRILTDFFPNNTTFNLSPTANSPLISYIQGDLRKFLFIKKMYEKNPGLFHQFSENLEKVLKTKTSIEDSKKITKTLLNRPISIDEHNTFMNETDRTIVALLWHENIIDAITERANKEKAFVFYTKILDNMCFADYIDRITFQNQIWQFNEMSSMMKTFYNNKMYHDAFPENAEKFQPQEVRFTKVLTKYSTEYNNQLFIYNMCQELDMDKKDMIAFFQELRLIYGGDFLSNPEIVQIVEEMFENYNINKLDIKRIYRYLDKNVKKETEEVDFGEDEGEL